MKTLVNTNKKLIGFLGAAVVVSSVIAWSIAISSFLPAGALVAISLLITVALPNE